MLRLYPHQAKIFKYDPRIRIVPKGRRAGLTHGGAIYIYLAALKGIYKNILWGDTIHSNTRRYIERFFMPNLKSLPKDLWHWDRSMNQIRICETLIDFRSADNPYNWEGFSYDFVFLNEAGIILKNPYIWQNAVQPMLLDTKGTAVIAGTPKGKNFFHTLAQKATDPLNDRYVLHRVTGYDNPLLSVDDLDALKEDYPDDIKRQEIFGEFIDSAGSVFRNARECATVSTEEPLIGMRYFMGVDLARKEDFTVIKVLRQDKSTGKAVEVYSDRFNNKNWDVQLAIIVKVAKKYNNATLLVDATGVGDAIFQSLVSAGLKVKPFMFSNSSKLSIVQSLIIAFETKAIAIIDDDVTLGELSAYEYEITTSGNLKFGVQNYHDDTVMALALAYECVKHHKHSIYVGVQEY